MTRVESHHAAPRGFSSDEWRLRRIKAARTSLIALLTLLSLSIIVPFAWMILTSFKSPAEAYAWPPSLFPKDWLTTNYHDLFKQMPFLRMYGNSLFVSTTVATLNILTAVPAAYAFARLRFPGRDFWFGLHMLAMMIPWHVTLIPAFLLIRKLGWYDTYTALIVPSIASAFTVFLLVQYYRSLPRSLEESVLVDGGTWYHAMRHIALPASRGAIAAAWLFSFLGNWQSFIWPLIVLQTPEKMLLPVGLVSLQSLTSVNVPVLMAGTTLATVPTIIAYLFVQQYLTDAAMTSGLKG